MAGTWTTKWKWDTGFNADSVEWCPVDPHTDILVCATYQLEKQEQDEATRPQNQTRLGRIYLFKIDESTTELDPIFSIECSGVLDQKWCAHKINGHIMLAAVCSDGLVKLFQLITEEGKITLLLKTEESIGEDRLALSVDWSTDKTVSSEPRLVVSDSKGFINVFTVQDKLVKLGVWNVQGFEEWTCGFNYWNADVFYSGGDDCIFKCYDARMAELAVTKNRSHEAGVTAVRSNVEVEHQLITGSYDEKVRLWDTRNLKSPVTEMDVKGGVWRLKYHPQINSKILVACMYGGFRILNLEKEFSILSEYLEHESIAYGADWKKTPGNKSIIATCSFYDSKMNISEIDL